jgi:hypothetical protein
MGFVNYSCFLYYTGAITSPPWDVCPETAALNAENADALYACTL